MNMKDGLLSGIVIGMIAGALLFKHSNTAREIINKGEKCVKNELNELAKDFEKTASKLKN